MALPPELRALAAEVSNWGRWGDDDEIGTLNLIDTAAVARGVAAARTGTRFSLAIRLDANGPQLGTIPGRINPLHTMVAINVAYTGDPDDCCFSDDVLTMGLQACTHWDGLAHVSYGGLLYNGHPASSTTAEQGATRCGIHRVGSIVSRGILLDVARALGRDVLAPRHAISEDDLEAAVELAGVRPEPGDVVLVRTGQMTHPGRPPAPPDRRPPCRPARPGRRSRPPPPPAPPAGRATGAPRGAARSGRGSWRW
jgi:kynurenine formamidase